MDYHVLFESFDKQGATRWLHNSEIGLLVFGLVLVIGLIGEYGKPKSERWKRLTDTFELLVILGVIGELAFDGLIFGFSGRLDDIREREIAAINVVASSANERSKILESKNLEQAKRIIDLEIEFGLRVPKVEANVGNLQTAVRKSNEREYPREIDQHDLAKATGGLKRSLRSVTLIRLGDPVAGPYATNLGTALKKLKPPFKVNFEDIPSSRFSGVIVCENGEGDRKVGKALERAVIVSEIKKITAEECLGEPAPASGPSGLIGVIANPLGLPVSRTPRAGTVIFVGHQRLPPQN